MSQSCPTVCNPWTAVHQASLSISSFWSLLKLMSITSVMPSKHLILCHPLFLPPSIFLSIRVFSNELVLLIRWPKYRSFNFSINPSSEYPGLISFKIDWLSLGLMQDTGCLGLVHWDDPERWYGEGSGGGFRIGNTCIPVADSC